MTPDDKVLLVTPADEAIGEMDKLTAHRYPLHRHRAVSVWLWRKSSGEVELLLQQRSRQKIVGALWWGNTICGNVFPGETYEECAQRRLRVELGIETTIIHSAYKFEYRSYANNEYGEHEIDQVFVGEYGGEVRPNPDEVVEFAWVRLFELQTVIAAWRQQNPSYPTAVESLKLTEEQLPEKTQPVSLVLSGKTILMVPWSMMMLLDERLWQAFK